MQKEDDENIIEHAVLDKLLGQEEEEVEGEGGARKGGFSKLLVDRMEQLQQLKQRQQKSNMKKEHHKNSKHRKILENVHKDIVGFMAPVPYPQSNSSISDVLYTVIFGK